MTEWPILRAKHVAKLAQTQTEPRERVPPYIYDDIIERIEKGDTWFKFIVDEYVTISLRESERIPREKYNEIMQTVEKVFLNESRDQQYHYYHFYGFLSRRTAARADHTQAAAA